MTSGARNERRIPVATGSRIVMGSARAANARTIQADRTMRSSRVLLLRARATCYLKSLERTSISPHHQVYGHNPAPHRSEDPHRHGSADQFPATAGHRVRE